MNITIGLDKLQRSSLHTYIQ